MSFVRRFKIGDTVRMVEPYRSQRLQTNPYDSASLTSSKVVGLAGEFLGHFCIRLEGHVGTWLENVFEHEGGPW